MAPERGRPIRRCAERPAAHGDRDRLAGRVVTRRRVGLEDRELALHQDRV
jgi:hypothetical protein